MTEQPPLQAGAIAVTSLVEELDKLEMITPEPVWVNPELARLCRGVSADDLKRVEKDHGPHAFSQITISMNDIAAEAFENQATEYPEGSVIVKSKDLGWTWGGEGRRSLAHTAEESADPGADGVGGMVKRHSGYAPQSGDWEYFYFEDPARVEHGLIQSCVQCHQKAQSSDYVFATWDEPADGGY